MSCLAFKINCMQAFHQASIVLFENVTGFVQTETEGYSKPIFERDPPLQLQF